MLLNNHKQNSEVKFLKNVIVRCSHDADCLAYQYTEIRPGNCILINSNPSAENGQTFLSNGLSSIYKKGLAFQISKTKLIQSLL